MNEDHFKNVVKALKDKGVDLCCPRCGHTDFGVMGSGAIFEAEEELTSRAAITVITYCERCGYISQHLKDALLADNSIQPNEE